MMWIRRLFCKHEWKFIRTIKVLGDDGRYLYNESAYRCEKCLKLHRDNV